jgi:hypothetical protein
MNQSRLQSLVEAGVNTLIGLVTAFPINVIVLAHYGFKGGLDANAKITAIFTVWSVIRGYGVRRFFNSYLQRFVAWVLRLISRFLKVTT